MKKIILAVIAFAMPTIVLQASFKEKAAAAKDRLSIAKDKVKDKLTKDDYSTKKNQIRIQNYLDETISFKVPNGNIKQGKVDSYKNSTPISASDTSKNIIITLRDSSDELIAMVTLRSPLDGGYSNGIIVDNNKKYGKKRQKKYVVLSDAYENLIQHVEIAQ